MKDAAELNAPEAQMIKLLEELEGWVKSASSYEKKRKMESLGWTVLRVLEDQLVVSPTTQVENLRGILDTINLMDRISQNLRDIEVPNILSHSVVKRLLLEKMYKTGGSSFPVFKYCVERFTELEGEGFRKLAHKLFDNEIEEAEKSEKFQFILSAVSDEDEDEMLSVYASDKYDLKHFQAFVEYIDNKEKLLQCLSIPCTDPDKIRFILATAEEPIDPSIIHDAVWDLFGGDNNIEPLKLMVDYASQNCSQIFNQKYEGRSLIVSALCSGSDEIQKTAILMANGSVPDTDDNGDNPLDMLEEVGAGETKVAKDIRAYYDLQRDLVKQKTLTEHFIQQVQEAGVDLSKLPPALEYLLPAPNTPEHGG